MRGRALPGLAALVLAACSGIPEGPYPVDAELQRLFAENVETFQGLAENPGDSTLYALVGIHHAQILSRPPDLDARFLVWYHDLPGPGGCSKGFAYLTRAPLETVDSIGSRWADCPPDEAEIYRPLEGNWYLFLTATN